MKTFYIKLLIAILFLGMSTPNNAQTQQIRSGEFQSIEGGEVTTGFPIFYTEDTFPNITFQYSNNYSELNAHLAIIQAQQRQFDRWLERQKDVFKKEIQKQLEENFSDFKKAQKAFYKEKELENVKASAKPLKEKYKTKTDLKKELRSQCIANIKLLDLRANEINSGNVNNSKYGHLKYGSTPIGNLKSLSQINNLRANEIVEFKNNQWRLEHESKMYDFIRSLTSLTNRNDDILNNLYHNQLKYYDSFDDFGKLDIMQSYIHDAFYNTYPLIYGHTKGVQNYGDQSYVEWYSMEKFPAEKLFVFHPDYWEELVRYPTGPVVAQQEHERLMNQAINEALNEVSNPDFLADVAIAGLGARNEAFVNEKPSLEHEVEEYFKVNDFSKVSSDCMNYLLNQLQDGGDFTPNTSLYESLNTPLYQNAQNPNRALNWQLGNQAVREGFTNFGNVLSELLKDNAYPAYEGRIIRDMFGVNGLNVNSFILNEWLGSGFYFKKNNGNSVEIQYDNNNGTILANNNTTTNTYLNNLVENLNTRLNSSLTNEQKRWLFLNPRSIFEFNNYLSANNNSSFEKELVKFEIETELSDCNYNLGSNDCIEAIRNMAIGLRALHGEEGELMANYFESVISDLSEFTRQDVEAFYGIAKSITLDYNRRMRTFIFNAFVEGITPIVEIALFEVGGPVAIRLLGKIPISWVYRGTRLNSFVRKVGLLGEIGSNNTIRIVKTNAPFTNAKELFKSLTKHKIGGLITESNGALKANMGNGNFIIFRPVTASSTGFPGTITLDFRAAGIWTNVRNIKFRYP